MMFVKGNLNLFSKISLFHFHECFRNLVSVEKQVIHLGEKFPLGREPAVYSLVLLSGCSFESNSLSDHQTTLLVIFVHSLLQ